MKIPEIRKKKGQGAFEYILLLAGILLIVVIIVVVLKSGLTQQSSTNIGASGEKIRANAAVQCLDFCGDGAWAWVKSANPSYTVSPNTEDCPLKDGFEGASRCFYTASKEIRPDNCQAANATVAHIFNSTGGNATEYDGVAPNNAKFCQLVQQSQS